MSTIAAIATAPGEGGVAIIRLSGPEALSIADRCFSGDVTGYKSHTAHFGTVICPKTQEPVDQALLLVMRAPNSYTGEDVVEIQCHGGSLISRRVLASVLEAGAGPAGPGAFTFRAYMNGKIDLAQAEAVQSLIMAKNDLALEAAKDQLQGALSKRVLDLKSRLTEIAALFEAWVDFPDEDLAFAPEKEVEEKLESIAHELERYIASYDEGRVIHDGLQLALIGAPNVGKSSLLNALLDQDRAIVSPTAGTTRDLVQERMRLFGLHLLLTDTAGIRSTSDAIEYEGIRRSKEMIAKADLLLVLLDANQGLTAEDEALLKEIPLSKSILIWNKIDLQPPPHLEGALAISAKQGEGIDLLKRAIEEKIWKRGAPSKEELVITHVRHKEALSAAYKTVCSAKAGMLAKASPELLTSDIRASLESLSSIIGSDIQEDILTKIFSTFCIGK